LEDGSVFIGAGFGHRGTQTGEVVFNTSMIGYQEILTDPSYCGQIVTMTYPLIGNYGVNAEDLESARPQVSGLAVRELARIHSSYRATMNLDDYLAQNNVIGIHGIDTRALTRKLRMDGAMRGTLSTEISDAAECVRLARSATPMTGADLVRQVAPTKRTDWDEGLDHGFTSRRRLESQRFHVIAIDCGMKRNILRHLVDIGCRVQIYPPTVPAGEVLDAQPDGVFISNGPGDPEAVEYAISLMKGLIGRIPIFGICLGHQLLALAMGARTFKLKFGHRGANHPVRNLATGRVEITSQNHGFAVDSASLAAVGGVATHLNLNDQTLEGFVHRQAPVLAVQYHPEAGPGPHDATYLFDCFATMMQTKQAPNGAEMAAAQAALASRHADARGAGPSLVRG
jgi:carbamoyl-phosphate synthase small subunit